MGVYVLQDLGIVVIGRNEGDRLRQCLLSVRQATDNINIIYVDSGSTDDSISRAKSLGVEVVELDLSTPFTAARARNEGFARAIALNPQLKFVQFVDGDCTVVAGWLKTAYSVISQRHDLAVICGRRRETAPQQSVYNLLCDIEWDTPVGETDACGGDAMMRVEAFQQVGGFNPTLIAGEEPELCLRLRNKGWKILRYDADMTLHDAQITRFGQWWKRALRAGHAYVEVPSLHPQDKQQYWLKENNSIRLWGFFLPATVVGLFWLTKGWVLLLLLGYLIIIYKIYGYMLTTGMNAKSSLTYAIACVAAKFPQMQGQLQFYLGKLGEKRQNIIEYK